MLVFILTLNQVICEVQSCGVTDYGIYEMEEKKQPKKRLSSLS